MRRDERPAAIVTCEHGGNRIPERYAALFESGRSILETHRGYDRGALALARRIARELEAPLLAATTSRLLVDLNRSEGHLGLFSRFTKPLSDEEKERLLRLHYRPHRIRVEDAVRRALERRGRVVHIAVHTFTPRLRGVVRKADVGLLYDPRRAVERRLCLRWRELLEERLPRHRVRLNYPYRGWTDGLAASLRAMLAPNRYAGVELEINQKRLRRGAAAARGLAIAIADSLRRALEG